MADFTIEKIRHLLLKGLECDVLTDQIERALNLAYFNHDGQYRDPRNSADSPIPYIVHPTGVAIIAHKLLPYVNLEDRYDDIISACLTHDLIEDTKVTPKELAKKTSERTMELVVSLTKPLVQPNSTHHQRNEQFFRQIVAAGQTAMFIKVCDHCHNLSRPYQTPTRLLEKAIRKGRSTILRYFDNGRLPEQLKKEYLQYVTKAEEESGKIKQQDNANDSPWTLEKAINYCVQIASRKVLEIHDLVEILQEISNATFVRLTSPQVFAEEEIFQKLKLVKQNLRAQIKKQIANGAIEIQLLPKDVKILVTVPADVVYVLHVPWSSSVGNDKTIIVGIDEKVKYEWVASEPLQLIISFLSERLRAQERDLEETLIDELKNLKLHVDIEDVRQLQLSSGGLKQLRELLNYGEFVRKKLHYILEYKLTRGVEITDLPIIESRLKSPQSFIKKMISRNIPNFSQVDDVVGFRIVCMSTQEAEKISHDVISCLSSVFPKELDKNQRVYQEVNINKVSSHIGYKALHIYFSIPMENNSDIYLGCEFQIRTAFQDAWARVSHVISYKNNIHDNKESSNATQKTLRELGDFRDKADIIISKLLKAKE